MCTHETASSSALKSRIIDSAEAMSRAISASVFLSFAVALAKLERFTSAKEIASGSVNST